MVCVDEALADAGLNVRQIDKVVLVGGASRTPMVRRLLEEQLQTRVHDEVDPDLCVAMGAAIQGGLVAGVDVGPVLVDITPHTLGIECLGPVHGMMTPHHFSPVIPRNTALPASRTEIYGTAHDRQQRAFIPVFQGEDDDARYNDPIGEILLEELSEVPRGNEILVRFDLDASGILKVTASERTTGRQKTLTVDNAISRFRASNRDEARARLDAAFRSAPGAETPDAAGAASLPPEVKQAVARAGELVAKAEAILPEANPDDADDLRELIEGLRRAVEARSKDDIDSLSAELEDVVFYLEDA
jgi:molecular chaperone DnaK